MRPTPAGLVDRRLPTVDVLPPPADGRFASTVGPIPSDVLARSTWSQACPVPAADLRYLTVSFRGFDGAVHTGELIVAARAAEQVVAVFAELFAAGFPLEEVRVVGTAELDAAPTGDGNTTMILDGGPVGAAFATAGWTWGGSWTVPVDLHHFSATGD